MAMRPRCGEVAATYVVALLFAIFPVLWAPIASLKTEHDVFAHTTLLIPSPATLENYVAIWMQSNLLTQMWISAVTTTKTVTICLAAGVPAAYGVAHYRYLGRDRILRFYLVLWMFPVVLMAIPLFIIMRNIGVLGTRFGLAVAYAGFLLPLFVWTMEEFLDAIPSEMKDPARIDGCSRAEAAIRAALPSVYGGLAACAVFVAVGSWNEYLFAPMLTTSSDSRTWRSGCS
jgi:multiple sugar transport system permease protein